jgi:hypothetical protein
MKKVQDCIDEIRKWMKKNKLKLNNDKTELLVITSPGKMKKVHLPQLEIGGCPIPTSDSCRNLGVMFDSFMNMGNQVKNICKSANFHLRNISSIRNVLSQDATNKLVHAFITSKLDNCNSVLYGIPQSDLRKLQAIQNSAARLVTRTRKYEHITPILQSLHWLPIKERIEYKLNLLTYKAVNQKAPSYISELVTPYTTSRGLRSLKQNKLTVP